MIKLTGYILSEKIYESQESIVYRGVRKEDSLPIIVKFLNQESPSKELLLAFKYEYEISKQISDEEAILVFDLVKYNDALGIVMEDIGGVALSEIIHSTILSLSEKLSLSIKITDFISFLHHKNIIHKNINPSNIIWNRNTNRLQIIDFGIAINLKREMRHKMVQSFFEGNPYYASPEQTGRINRPVDSRSDLYSLGITLYELFSGQLPFNAENESEILYSQISSKPEPPHLIKRNIPEMISIILLKLLEKDPEDGYQNAYGVKKDLEQCLENVLFDNDIIPFDAGKFDFSDQFRIPDKLYGRKEALETLQISFNDVAEGNSVIVAIDGDAGSGKTSLVQEFSKFVSLKKGLFVFGQFDPQGLNVPLQGILQTLHSLMQWLLSLPQNELEFWKKNILSTVAPNAGILTGLLPELEKVIGVQPPVIDLNPIESHNRFLIVFHDFLCLFASTEAPLVFFYDNLQWCDSTSLNLLKYIADKSRHCNILFVGAYRKNKLDETHPLIGSIEGINKRNINVHTLSLHPLEITAIDQMIADTFHRSTPDEETLSLAKFIYKKTNGSPVFIHQLLEALFEQGLFRWSECEWIWDINQIKKTPISDQVLDLISHKINQISPATQEILKIASCFGLQFDLELLSLVSERRPAEVGTLLWQAIHSEIIYPLNHNYKMMHLEEIEGLFSTSQIRFAFQHNLIHQFIYSQIQFKDQEFIHLKIGRVFAQYTKGREEVDFIFNMVNHMNKGKALIHVFSERKALCELNIEVANKAMKTTIFSMATNYFATAESLLTNEEWLQEPMKWHYTLFNLSEVLFLSGELTQAEEICEKVYSLSNNPLFQAKIHNLKARILEFQGRIPETLQEIRKGLILFGVILPESNEEIERRIGEEVMKLEKVINTDDMIEKLADLPLMEDQSKIQTMELLYNVIAPALQYNPALFVLSSLMMFDITRKYGVTSYSCKNFVDIGITHGPTFKDFAIGYRLGHTAFRLINRLNAESMKPAVYFSFTFASYRNKHYSEALHYYDMTYSTGIQIGDIQHAAYARVHKMHLYMQVGKKLSECREETEDTIHFLNEIKSEMPLLFANIILYMIKKYTLLEKIDNDDEYISKIHIVKNNAFLWRFYQYNSMYHYLHNDWKESKKWCQLSDQFLFASVSDFPGPEHSMLKGLLIVKLWDTIPDTEEIKLSAIQNSLDELKKATDLCPDNFAHKYHFLAAEVAILIRAPQEEVIDHYNQALLSLKENDFIHLKGLIYESLANFWQSKDNEMISKAYLREAHYLFKRWGALKKVNLMEEKHPFLKPSFISPSIPASFSQNFSDHSVNIATITTAIQTISSELQIGKLLYTVMSLILENTGARQGALLLVKENDKDLYIEAQKKSFDDRIEVLQSIPYRKSFSLCSEIIQYVSRSLEKMVLGNACKESVFKINPHVHEKQIKSILSIPILYRTKLFGVIYLEHDLAEDVFTEDRIEILKILSDQAMISIENARLYEGLEQKVTEKTVQLNQANEKLRLFSLRDPLTSLHNHRFISEFVSEFSMNFVTRKKQLQQMIEKRDLSIVNNVIGVFIIDLDHFTTINESYGQHAEDQVLQSVSKLLKKQIRADDFIVRWGESQFLIILNSTHPEFLDLFSQKVLNAVKGHEIQINDKNSINVTCSVGYCMMPIHVMIPDHLNLDQVINICDIALSIAKKEERDCAVRIGVNPDKATTPECKEYLLKMKKNEPIDEKFVQIIM